MEPRVGRVYRSINRPLTISGAERRPSFLAPMTGAGLFNFFGSPLDGVIGVVALMASPSCRHYGALRRRKPRTG